MSAAMTITRALPTNVIQVRVVSTAKQRALVMTETRVAWPTNVSMVSALRVIRCAHAPTTTTVSNGMMETPVMEAFPVSADFVRRINQPLSPAQHRNSVPVRVLGVTRRAVRVKQCPSRTEQHVTTPMPVQARTHACQGFANQAARVVPVQIQRIVCCLTMVIGAMAYRPVKADNASMTQRPSKNVPRLPIRACRVAVIP